MISIPLGSVLFPLPFFCKLWWPHVWTITESADLLPQLPPAGTLLFALRLIYPKNNGLIFKYYSTVKLFLSGDILSFPYRSDQVQKSETCSRAYLLACIFLMLPLSIYSQLIGFPFLTLLHLKDFLDRFFEFRSRFQHITLHCNYFLLFPSLDCEPLVVGTLFHLLCVPGLIIL